MTAAISANIVRGEGLGARPRLVIGGDQDAESARIALEREGHELVGVDPLVPGVIEFAAVEALGAESSYHRDRFRSIAEVQVGRTETEQGHEVIDQLLRQGVCFENATDAGGDRADGLELPEVKPLVETAPFELFPQLPCAETDARGVERHLVEPVKLEQPKAPIVLVSSERDFTPTLGGLFDLGRHGSRPPRNGVIAALEDASTGSGLLDDHTKNLLGQVRTGVPAKGYVRQA